MNDSELDNINEMLWSRVDTQMKFSYANFKSLYKMLSEQSYKNIGGFIYNFDVKTEKDISNAESVIVNCDEENDDSDSECKLRLESDSDSEEKNEEEKIDKQISKDEINNENRVTFKSKLLKEKLNQYFNNKFDIADYAKDYDFNCDSGVSSLSREQEMKRLVADIRKFIFTYQSDIKLNGTIIARIFHGIGTPRYPAEIWGRNRIFWRCHLDFDFENIVKVATDQLLNL
ncbi:unnamed protein product [Brachionus calyciflorus]|uniref:Uncharacterized protein n=1 Tax=Brachionus calyciflorus TaxID=104777 RepID=A0A813NG33_9BILA|nr:unnamed protein product [Brachionus calyciflorus]